MMFARTRPAWRPSPLAVVLVACVAVVFLLFCSGLHLPMWDARGRLAKRLAADPGVALPAGAEVTRAISIAYRDPAEHYAVEMPAADAAAFIAAVRAASRRAKDADAARPWTGYPAPDWWRPHDIPQVQRLDVEHRDGQGEYRFYYSPSGTTVYVFWART